MYSINCFRFRWFLLDFFCGKKNWVSKYLGSLFGVDKNVDGSFGINLLRVGTFLGGIVCKIEAETRRLIPTP